MYMKTVYYTFMMTTGLAFGISTNILLYDTIQELKEIRLSSQSIKDELHHFNENIDIG